MSKVSLRDFSLSNRRRIKKLELTNILNCFPVIEEIELNVAAKVIEVEKHFDYISRVVWNIEWVEVAYNWTNFGVDAALTGGIQIKYANRHILPHGIRKNSDFGALAYDTKLIIDNAAAKNVLLQSRFSFTKFTKDMKGLHITNDKRFAIVVQDDLSGTSNSVIEVYVEGWKYYE